MKRIKELEKESLSDDDIKKLLNGESNIITYTDLACTHDINDILGKNKSCVILFLTKDHYGHWTLLHEVKPGLLEFFDPYGTIIDDELDHIERNFRKKSKQNYPHLSSLLYESPYQISYNDYPFQKKSRDVSTCGKHVIIRSLMRHLSLEDYIKFLNEFDEDPDFLVTYLIDKISHNSI
jgi:hypothetical protein